MLTCSYENVNNQCFWYKRHATDLSSDIDSARKFTAPTVVDEKFRQILQLNVFPNTMETRNWLAKNQLLC